MKNNKMLRSGKIKVRTEGQNLALDCHLHYCLGRKTVLRYQARSPAGLLQLWIWPAFPGCPSGEEKTLESWFLSLTRKYKRLSLSRRKLSPPARAKAKTPFSCFNEGQSWCHSASQAWMCEDSHHRSFLKSLVNSLPVFKFNWQRKASNQQILKASPLRPRTGPAQPPSAQFLPTAALSRPPSIESTELTARLDSPTSSWWESLPKFSPSCFIPLVWRSSGNVTQEVLLCSQFKLAPCSQPVSAPDNF